MAISSGYYVPGSVSDSFVANKKNEQGEYLYDSLGNSIGIQEQAALQQLNKDYSTVIENAYSQYLSSRQGVIGSMMGQGYKEAYLANQKQAYMQAIAENNANAANVRQQLATQADQARASLQQMYMADVANYDRLDQAMAQYYDYLKTLTNDDGGFYIERDDKGESPLYGGQYSKEKIFEAGGIEGLEADMAKGYKDSGGIEGKTLSDWIKTNYLKGTDDDNNWWQWYLSEGYYNKYNKEYAPIEKEKREAQRIENERIENLKKTIVERGDLILTKKSSRSYVDKDGYVWLNEYGSFKKDNAGNIIQGIESIGAVLNKNYESIKGNKEKFDEMKEVYYLLSGKKVEENDLMVFDGSIYQYKYEKKGDVYYWQRIPGKKLPKDDTTFGDVIDAAAKSFKEGAEDFFGNPSW